VYFTYSLAYYCYVSLACSVMFKTCYYGDFFTSASCYGVSLFLLIAHPIIFWVLNVIFIIKGSTTYTGLGDCCWIISTMLGVDFRLRNRRRRAKDTLGNYPLYANLRDSRGLALNLFLNSLLLLVVSPWELILPKPARSLVYSGVPPLRRITG
jgi:hypothetical protein